VLNHAPHHTALGVLEVQFSVL